MSLSIHDPQSHDVQLQSIRPHALFSFGPSLSLFSKLQLPILVTAPRLTARFFRNPSSYTRYGQNGWYPRRGPTTRLAALDAEQIPNRKGTSRCVNDDPAPGQG